MADIIKDAIQNFLMPALKAYASNPVVYVRGSQSVEVQATYGQKLLRTHEQFGAVKIEWTDLDFIIAADDLHFDDGVLIAPRRGDYVLLTVRNALQKYEVLPFGNDPPWRWSDPHSLMYRIHTKLIDVQQL